MPVGAGLAGVVDPAAMLDAGSPPGADGDSHWRYLSGLLLAIGLAFWSTIPRIERRGRRFRLLTAIVVLGGLARLFGMLAGPLPSLAMFGALAMELAVTPGLAFWQWRLERRGAT